ncbi:MAG: hypothetical protein KA439_05315 [Rhizobacter sp.]|jgi:hypothetical protein|nr:hypothetical protein [Rhizobacter sp.]MBP6268289.1 hypothetical protein [Rhizobacter sp.]
MRMLLGIVGLLVTLAIVALIARTQLRQVTATAPAVSSEETSASAAEGGEPTATRDLPGKIQQDVTRAMQQAPQRDDDSR